MMPCGPGLVQERKPCTWWHRQLIVTGRLQPGARQPLYCASQCIKAVWGGGGGQSFVIS